MPYELSDLISRRREVKIEFYGLHFNVEYFVTKMTDSMAATLTRLWRDIERAEQRTKVITDGATDFKAAPGTPEAEAEDAALERALTMADNEANLIKARIDGLLNDVLAGWDLLKGGVPVAFTAEAMAEVPSEFEGRVIAAVLEDARGLGGPSKNGRTNITALPIGSSRKERRAASRRSQTG